MVDLIVLSPHLDDAVFSLGATISRAVEEGQTVDVVSFFSDAPPLEQVPDRLRVFADYQARRAEDAAALGVLGATPHWMGLVERAFREPHLSRLSQVFRTPARVDEFPNLDRVEEIVVGLLREHPGARLRAPLAVGHHFDHVEVFVGVTRALARAEAWDRISFYEDAYALGRRMREDHFVTRGRSWGRWGGPDNARLRMRGMFEFMASARRGPPVESYLSRRIREGEWRVSAELVTEAQVARKLDALTRYPSQLGALGGAEGWHEALGRYHAYWGGAEPRWIISPDSLVDPGSRAE